MFTLDSVEPSDAIETIKEKYIARLKSEYNICPTCVKLTYGGKYLEDHLTIEDYGIHADSTLLEK